MKKYLKRLTKYKKQVNDNGFSLLELVVAVGILLVLTGGGLLAYGGIQKRARVAAVESAASEVLTGAAAFQLDNKSDTNAVDAETEWNSTSKKDKNGKAQITVKVEESPTCLKVTATHVKSEQSIRQTGTGCIGNENGETPGGNDGNTNPGDNETGGENEGWLEAIDSDGNKRYMSSTLFVDASKDGFDSNVRAESAAESTVGSGINVHVSEWITQTDGYKVSDKLEYVGTSNGMVEYLVKSTSAGSWFDLNGPYDDSKEMTGVIQIELPTGSKWTAEPWYGTISTNSEGRSVWETTDTGKLNGTPGGGNETTPVCADSTPEELAELLVKNQNLSYTIEGSGASSTIVIESPALATLKQRIGADIDNKASEIEEAVLADGSLESIASAFTIDARIGSFNRVQGANGSVAVQAKTSEFELYKNILLSFDVYDTNEIVKLNMKKATIEINIDAACSVAQDDSFEDTIRFATDEALEEMFLAIANDRFTEALLATEVEFRVPTTVSLSLTGEKSKVDLIGISTLDQLQKATGNVDVSGNLLGLVPVGTMISSMSPLVKEFWFKPAGAVAPGIIEEVESDFNVDVSSHVDEAKQNIL